MHLNGSAPNKAESGHATVGLTFLNIAELS